MLNQEELERARLLAGLAEKLDVRKGELLRNMHLFCYEFTETALARLKPRNEFRILRKLAKLRCANVYRISKSLRDAGHYSTILRALRRMERKGLVRNVRTNHENRSQKTYEITLLGKAVTVLGQDDWKHAAEIIAARSPRFSDCQKICQTIGSVYYQYLTYHVIESLMYPTTLRDVDGECKQIEEAVAQGNENWIRKNIMPKLNDTEARSDYLQQIELLLNIPWMRLIAAKCIEEYVSEWKGWLETVEGIKQSTPAKAKKVQEIQNERMRIREQILAQRSAVLSVLLDIERRTGIVSKTELIYELVRRRKTFKEEAEQILAGLLREGVIYEPRDGYVKKT